MLRFHTKPDATLLKQFPTELARRLRVFPVLFDTGEDTLFVALADPLVKHKLEEIQALWGVNVVPLLGSETLLHQLIEQYFPLT